MSYLEQSFSVKFEYRVYFTAGLFDKDNPLFSGFLNTRTESGCKQKILFVLDEGVRHHHPDLIRQIREYFSSQSAVELIDEVIIIPGGEQAKNDTTHFDRLIEAVNEYGIDRHSYLAAIGGGAILDLAGYAAAVSHRGIKHIRIPTTVLSQNDSGVGVKNGINFFGKKNFLGSFVPPVAVFNDERFLDTLDERNWRSGIAEAIKVALIKDRQFFEWLEENAGKLAARDAGAMNYQIKRCAELHLQHIAGGDPFELGSSRPLDFGHWSAHKLEQLTGFDVLHGEAVAMGIALDSMYSAAIGWLSRDKAERIINLLIRLGFDVTHPQMQVEENSALLQGLNEFREHLGGRLTIMLLRDIGKGEEVHEIDSKQMSEAGRMLQQRSNVKRETLKVRET